MSSLSACSRSAHCSKFLFGQGCFSQLQQLPTKQVYKTWARNRESKDTEKRGFAAARSPTEQPSPFPSKTCHATTFQTLMSHFCISSTHLAPFWPFRMREVQKICYCGRVGNQTWRKCVWEFLSSGTNSSKSVFHGSQEPGVVLICFCFGWQTKLCVTPGLQRNMKIPP